MYHDEIDMSKEDPAKIIKRWELGEKERQAEQARRFDHAHNTNQALIADTQARHEAGQAVMRDVRAAQLLAMFEMSDERGKVTLLAIAGIHAARYPKEK